MGLSWSQAIPSTTSGCSRSAFRSRWPTGEYDDVQAGQYSSEDEVIAEALQLLEERDKLGVLRREIAIGIEQADRGELEPFEPHAALVRVRSPNTSKILKSQKICNFTCRRRDTMNAVMSPASASGPFKRPLRREYTRPHVRQTAVEKTPGTESAQDIATTVQQVVPAGRLRGDRLSHRLGPLARMIPSGEPPGLAVSRIGTCP
jgi:putative addiction module CopG family antidote